MGETISEADLLNYAMDAQGIDDDDLRAGIAAIAMGESALKPRSEVSYAHTSNDRIRMIFRSRLGDMDDDELDVLKADDVKFFDAVYGGRYGNTEPGDGYKYRGRGCFQLTFKDNYAAIGKAIGKDLVANPDLVNEPEIAAATAVAYMKQRYHGGGWEAMKRAVGNNTPDIAARKDALYEEYRESGEFDA